MPPTPPPRLDRIRVKIDHLKRSMLNPAAAVAAAAAARHAVSTDDGAAAFIPSLRAKFATARKSF